MNKAQEILKQAREIAASDANWAEFSNALYDPVTGILKTAFPARAERDAFTKTPEYQEIRKLMQAAMQRTGLVDGATPRKSGKFIVRLPSTLHAALEREAAQEGVSLNLLVVTKLALQLKPASFPATLPRRKSA